MICLVHVCVNIFVQYTLVCVEGGAPFCLQTAHSREARAPCGEDVFLPRCADCCSCTVLTLQSPRRESEVCQPVQLITPPLSHSGQRVFAGEPKRVMGLWRSTQRHSNSGIGEGAFFPFIPWTMSRRLFYATWRVFIFLTGSSQRFIPNIFPISVFCCLT